MTHKFLSAAICTMTFFALSPASAHDAKMPDDHAPIGVMGDHNHKQGEWMMSYRYSQMHMEDAARGTNSVELSNVLNDYMVAPVDMDMEMHMFGLMYGATDKLTLMGMVPYVHKEMTLQNRMGTRFRTRTDGVGDLKFGGIYTLYDSGVDKEIHRRTDKLLLNFGTTVPTGSIDERGHTPMGANQKLAYGMQLGSGTFDPNIGLTYTHKNKDWSWGTQANALIRLGQNDEGYRLGNQYKATGWLARSINKNLSISGRLEGSLIEKIHGSDDELNPAMASGADTANSGGKRVDGIIGINLYDPDGKAKGHRLAAEFGLPLYQDLNGVQLQTEYRVMLGWQFAF